jgi:hypothetical protein
MDESLCIGSNVWTSYPPLSWYSPHKSVTLNKKPCMYVHRAPVMSEGGKQQIDNPENLISLLCMGVCSGLNVIMVVWSTVYQTIKLTSNHTLLESSSVFSSEPEPSLRKIRWKWQTACVHTYSYACNKVMNCPNFWLAKMNQQMHLGVTLKTTIHYIWIQTSRDPCSA